MATPQHTADDDFEDMGTFEGDPEFAEVDDAEPQGDVSVEERARAQGWRPLSEYNGPPGRWSDAEEYLRRGEENWPLMRAANRRLTEKVARMEPELNTLRNTVTEQNAAIAAAMSLARRANEQGYQRGLAELKAKQRAAVATGDEEVYDQVEEQIRALETTRAEVETAAPAAAPAPPPQAAPPVPPEIAAFRAANPWFNTDPNLRQAMIDLHTAEIRRDNATGQPRSLQQQLDAALRRMQAAYPEIAPSSELEEEEDEPVAREPAQRPRTRMPPVGVPQAGARPRMAPGSRTDPFMQIADEKERADVRASFESIKRMDAAYTAAEHMAIYNDPKIDVLELRKQRKA